MLLHWLVLFGIITSVLTEIEDGVSYVVGPGKRDCFYRILKIGDRMDFDLQVLSGGDVDITVTINAPSGKEKLYEIRQTEINNEIEIDESGPFEICFDNSFSTFSEKVIYFDLGIDEHNKTGLDHAEMFDGLVLQKDTYEHTSELLKSLDGIGLKFETISQMQSIFRSKHRRHMFLQDSNLWLVTWFSVASCVIMVIVSLLQVYLIRNLFATKTGRGMQNNL